MSINPTNTPVQLVKTNKSGLQNTSVTNGCVYFVDDTKELFFDFDSTRFEVKDILILDTESQRTSALFTPLANKFYFVIDTQRLWFYQNNTWYDILGSVKSVNNTTPDASGNITLTIPDAQIQSDWNQTNTSAKDYIKNKPNIPSGVVVDQIYDATSPNAQAGTAVAQAVSSKVSDVTINDTSVVTSGTAAIPNASGDVYGVVKLTNSLVSTSNTVAATGSTVNIFGENVIGIPKFSSSATYAVGDLVRSGQYCYRCITAIETAHTWNVNEWELITIQEEIDGKVDDVTVSGTSIVSNGVAVIPIAAQQGDYGLVKLSSDSTGIMLSSTGTLQTRRATDADIAAKTQINRPIVPANLDLAVKTSVTTNATTLTDAEKTNANIWLGSVKDVSVNGTSIVDTNTKEAAIPIAAQSGSTPGLVKIPSTYYGMYINSTGYLMTAAATTTDINNKSGDSPNGYKPIVPNNLDYAVKTSVTTNANTLTDTEKANACAWLGASQGIIKRVWTE